MKRSSVTSIESRYPAPDRVPLQETELRVVVRAPEVAVAEAAADLVDVSGTSRRADASSTARETGRATCGRAGPRAGRYSVWKTSMAGSGMRNGDRDGVSTSAYPRAWKNDRRTVGEAGVAEQPLARSVGSMAAEYSRVTGARHRHGGEPSVYSGGHATQRVPSEASSVMSRRALPEYRAEGAASPSHGHGMRGPAPRQRGPGEPLRVLLHHAAARRYRGLPHHRALRAQRLGPVPREGALLRPDEGEHAHVPERAHLSRPHRVPGGQLQPRRFLQPADRLRGRRLPPAAAKGDLHAGGLAAGGDSGRGRGRRADALCRVRVQRDEGRVLQPGLRRLGVDIAVALSRHPLRARLGR